MSSVSDRRPRCVGWHGGTASICLLGLCPQVSLAPTSPSICMSVGQSDRENIKPDTDDMEAEWES